MERVNRSDPSGNERLRFPTLAPEKWRKDGARGFCGVLTGTDSCGNERMWFPTLAPVKRRKDGARGFCGVLTRSGSCENEPLRILLEGL